MLLALTIAAAQTAGSGAWQKTERKSENIRRANRVIQTRTFVLMLVLGVAVFLVLALKLYQLQIKQHDYYQSKALDQQTRSTVVTASRGTIYDRNGNELAVSATAETVFLSPKELAEELEKPETKWTKESLSARPESAAGCDAGEYSEQMERILLPVRGGDAPGGRGHGQRRPGVPQ